MTIPFIKAHGAGNDFLLSWADRVPAVGDLAAMARAICDRHTGVGADGWMLVRDTSIRLFNADGSEAEISGNGTRCAAAMLMDAGRASSELTIETGAGPKHLRMIERSGRRYVFEMNMGKPAYRDDQVRFRLPLRSGDQEVAILDVGNPQCVVVVESFPTGLGSKSRPRSKGIGNFPSGATFPSCAAWTPTPSIARFYERGVGVTLSSGTGSTGAAVAAILRKLAESPVDVRTPAGDVLRVRWDDSVYLTGPAEIVASGEYYVTAS